MSQWNAASVLGAMAPMPLPPPNLSKFQNKSPTHNTDCKKQWKIE